MSTATYTGKAFQLHLKCPACGGNCNEMIEGGLHWVYCPSGPCPSVVANDGASGPDTGSAIAAFQQLEDRINEELAASHEAAEYERERDWVAAGGTPAYVANYEGEDR